MNDIGRPIYWYLDVHIAAVEQLIKADELQLAMQLLDMVPGWQRDHYPKGVKVCHRWEESFELFFADMGHPPSPKHSIDRIDPYGNYEPSNCRWATATQQINNRRKSCPTPTS